MVVKSVVACRSVRFGFGVCVCVCVVCVCVCASLLDGIVERKSTCMYVCVCVCAHTAVLLEDQ